MFHLRWMGWNEQGARASLARKPRSFKAAGGQKVPERFPEVLNPGLLTGCTYTSCKQGTQQEKDGQTSLPQGAKENAVFLLATLPLSALFFIFLL